MRWSDRRSESVWLVLWLVLSFALWAWTAAAQVPAPGDEAPEPRDLGNTAVMSVYWYAPETLEITHVEIFLYKDEGLCEAAIGKAFAIAMPHASMGDTVEIVCTSIHVHDRHAAPKGSTIL